MFATIGGFHFSSSSESDDDDVGAMRISKRILRDHCNILNMPDIEFVKNFRVNKELFGIIFNDIAPHMKAPHRNTAIPATLKLAAFLRFLAGGGYQNGVGNEFLSCMSQPKVSEIIAECLDLFQNNFCSKWITLQLTEDEENEVKHQFNLKFQFPGVVGCVDGTHVKIKAPNAEVRHLYYNRKGFYSINAMIICDHNLVIKYVDARHPGANHDAFVWKSSEAETYFKTNYTAGKRNTWILGDAGYQCLPYLMTPFRNPREQSENIYNDRLCKARNTVERCFGVLKNRFRCIIGERGLRYSPEKATKIINACCAIHNACVFYKNECPPIEHDLSDSEDLPAADSSSGDLTTSATIIRRQIAESLAS